MLNNILCLGFVFSSMVIFYESKVLFKQLDSLIESKKQILEKAEDLQQSLCGDVYKQPLSLIKCKKKLYLRESHYWKDFCEIEGKKSIFKVRRFFYFSFQCEVNFSYKLNVITIEKVFYK